MYSKLVELLAVVAGDRRKKLYKTEFCSNVKIMTSRFFIL
jgi:hypothetical protein